MGWKSKVPVAGGLGLVVIGGVAMAVPSASAATNAAGDVVTATVQQIADGAGHAPLGFGRGHHGRALRGAAVAEELGIDVDVYRDAVKAVIEARQAAGEDRPDWASMTPQERLDFRAGWIADVAAELGISAADLEAAHDTVFQAKLDEAVANEKLTQAEADEILAAYQDGTLFDLQQEHRIEVLGDRLDQLLENGVIDDTQYDALQAELDAEDLQGFRELLRQYREDNGFDGPGFRGLRGLDGLGGPGGDAGFAVEGISL
jgi:hypothetical protein